MGQGELEELRRQIEDMIDRGWIRPSESEFGAPVLFVPKKGGKLRMCIDYCGLNRITQKNAYPLPHIDDLLDVAGGCKVFSKIDLKSGYHQIEVNPSVQHETAFKTRDGLYEFIIMPFGLTNAPATFECLMDKVLRHQLNRFVVVYLDDILIFSKSMEEHDKHLEEVLQILKEAQLHLNLEKSEFGRDNVIYLGHRLSANGLEPEATNVEVIRKWPQLVNVCELRSFLGLASYYRKFVPKFSVIAHPLSRLTSKNVAYAWCEKCETVFQALKEALVSHPVLCIADPNLTFVVTTNVSQYGIGAVLQQDDGDGLRPLEYYSNACPTTRFIIADWKDFTSQIYDIKLDKTSGRQPEANGLAEEINQTVIQLLRALIVPDLNTWDKELHKVKGLYNNSIHSAIGVTPNQLQYGWQLRNPLSYLFPERSPGLTSGMPGYNAKYACLRKAAIAAMNKRQYAMIKHANKWRKEGNFKVGSYVWVKMSEFSDEEGASRKLLPLYYGPWQVLKVIGDDFGPSYVIDVPPHLRTYPVFHALGSRNFFRGVKMDGRSRRNRLEGSVAGVDRGSGVTAMHAASGLGSSLSSGALVRGPPPGGVAVSRGLASGWDSLVGGDSDGSGGFVADDDGGVEVFETLANSSSARQSGGGPAVDNGEGRMRSGGGPFAGALRWVRFWRGRGPRNSGSGTAAAMRRGSNPGLGHGSSGGGSGRSAYGSGSSSMGSANGSAGVGQPNGSADTHPRGMDLGGRGLLPTPNIPPQLDGRYLLSQPPPHHIPVALPSHPHPYPLPQPQAHPFMHDLYPHQPPVPMNMPSPPHPQAVSFGRGGGGGFLSGRGVRVAENPLINNGPQFIYRTGSLGRADQDVGGSSTHPPSQPGVGAAAKKEVNLCIDLRGKAHENPTASASGPSTSLWRTKEFRTPDMALLSLTYASHREEEEYPPVDYSDSESDDELEDGDAGHSRPQDEKQMELDKKDDTPAAHTVIVKVKKATGKEVMVEMAEDDGSAPQAEYNDDPEEGIVLPRGEASSSGEKDGSRINIVI
ncbi:hypothetical protein CBR_g23424 [Chara braunii]|nr:hypothetical protein CBR_g23424 [Chara braunii]|eukprot:GBG77099.1 hypothetical protein CBR_g23424 [Chara braunii]